MEDYTKEDVIEALVALDFKSRKRYLVDQRSYLLGILCHKFKLSENTVDKLTGIKRSRITYAKRLPIQFKDDKLYQQNVYVYAQLFPFNFDTINDKKPHRKHTVILHFDDKFGTKLKTIRDILGHDDIRKTVRHMLEKYIKLWEE
jgi:hypothetical protein